MHILSKKKKWRKFRGGIQEHCIYFSFDQVENYNIFVVIYLGISKTRYLFYIIIFLFYCLMVLKMFIYNCYLVPREICL